MIGNQAALVCHDSVGASTYNNPVLGAPLRCSGDGLALE